MGQVIDAILGLGGPGAYVVIGLLAFGEAAAFVGLLLPGEVAVLLGGVLASRGQVSLPLILLVAAVAAIAGDSAGYEISRRWGRRLVGTRFLRPAAPPARASRVVRAGPGDDVVPAVGRDVAVVAAVAGVLLVGHDRCEAPHDVWEVGILGSVSGTPNASARVPAPGCLASCGRSRIAVSS